MVIVLIMMTVGDDNDGHILTKLFSFFSVEKHSMGSGSFSSGPCDELLRKKDSNNWLT